MNKQLIENIQTETYFMLNFEITFTGIKEWFSLAGECNDDIFIFRAMFMPNTLPNENRLAVNQLIIYRHEDAFFQMNRDFTSDDPLHQLLIRIFNYRILEGEDNALINLWLILNKDKNEDNPLYPSLHGLFE